jgi:hypothetical protein
MVDNRGPEVAAVRYCFREIVQGQWTNTLCLGMRNFCFPGVCGYCAASLRSRIYREGFWLG